tara:strand:+ start:385 stop:822 length:438 start_codon:yes stop_codon:yes gene_type:complete
MTPENQQKLALYLASTRHKTHKWGEWDCMLFGVDWVDILLDTNHAESIRGQYDSQKTAVKFARKYLKAPAWLDARGFKDITEVKDEKESAIQQGDIWLQDMGVYHVAWIMFGGIAHGVNEQNGLVRVVPDAFKKQTRWRFNVDEK